MAAVVHWIYLNVDIIVISESKICWNLYIMHILVQVKKQVWRYTEWFKVHRAMCHNIISIVKPTRCTSVSNLFYFVMTLYMFWTSFPSVIRSLRLYDKCLLLYVQSWTPDDGWKDHSKHVVSFQNKMISIHWCM